MQKAAAGMGVFSHSQIHKMTQSTLTPGNNRETQGRKKIELTHTQRNEGEVLQTFTHRRQSKLFGCENVG